MDATTDNKLAVRGNGRFVTNAPAVATQQQPDEMDVILEQLPRWLAYLVGAFPAAKTNKMTYFAYEDSFADEDQETMFQAVRMAVKKHRFQTFPTIGELENLLKHAPYDMTENRQPLLVIAARRKQLLEQMYADEMNLSEWWKFIDDCQRFGYLSNAVHMKGRLVRWWKEQPAHVVEAVTE